MSAIEVWGHGDIRKVMAELDEHGFVLDQFKPQGSGMLVWFFVGNSAGEAIACSVWTRSPEHFARQLNDTQYGRPLDFARPFTIATGGQ
jgi:hypothetical protein